MLEVVRLSYVYSPKTPFAKQALRGVDLKIEDGDFFGIIGGTGAGKSTLVSHFNALTRVQKKSGTVVVDGVDLSGKRLDLKKLRASVGMVFQYPEHQLFDDTVEKDVAFGPKNLGLSKDEQAARAKQAIELVGLDYAEFAQRSPFELSGGQKRRVAIAGVIAMHPKILVLDEPTAGLDPKGKREIMKLILNIKQLCPTVMQQDSRNEKRRGRGRVHSARIVRFARNNRIVRGRVAARHRACRKALRGGLARRSRDAHRRRSDKTIDGGCPCVILR